MQVVNGTAVQVPHHRRAILTGRGVATSLLGWRRKVGAIGGSLRIAVVKFFVVSQSPCCTSW